MFQLFSKQTTSDTTISLLPMIITLAKSTGLDTFKVEWRVTAWDSKGNFTEAFEISNSFYLAIDIPIGLDEIDPEPPGFRLHGNYPNPFNPSTTIRYDLPQASRVRLTIYDIMGRKVYKHGAAEEAGYRQIVWQGTDNSGRPVAAGIYLYRLVASPANGEEPYMATRKMLLLK